MVLPPAAADCERIHESLLAQPVNSLTSLAYVGVGIWIARRARSSPTHLRTAHRVLGATVAGVGLGSALFHGSALPAGRWLHDVPLAAIPLFAALHGLGGRRGWSPVAGTRRFGAGVVGLGALFAAAPDSSVAVTAALAAVAGASELATRERVPREEPERRRRRRLLLAGGGALAVGAVVNALGRTAGPLCRPDALWQAHGAWHVLTAAALGAWAALGLERARPVRPGGRDPASPPGPATVGSRP